MLHLSECSKSDFKLRGNLAVIRKECVFNQYTKKNNKYKKDKSLPTEWNKRFKEFGGKERGLKMHRRIIIRGEKLQMSVPLA